MDDTDFCMVSVSMLREWMIFISTLGTYTTSMEVIAQIMAHNSMLACDCLSHGTPAVVKALATTHNQQSWLTCMNPVCRHVGHTIDKCFKHRGGMEGQYPNWWKKKGSVTTFNTQKPKPTVITTDSAVGSTSGSGEFYALVTDSNLPQTNTSQCQVVTFADLACGDHCCVHLTFVRKTGSIVQVSNKKTIKKTSTLQEMTKEEGNLSRKQVVA